MPDKELIVFKTLKHLFYALSLRESIANTIIQNIDDYYNQWEIDKYDDDGKKKFIDGVPDKRIISAPIDELKVIQKTINKVIFKTIVLPPYCYGGVKGRDNILNAKKHKGKKFIFTTDIKSFYPSITNLMVFRLFKRLGCSRIVANKLVSLVTYKNMLPQGTPTSSFIANLVFQIAGDRLFSLCNENNIIFTTFIDDLTFSSDKDFKPLTNKIVEIVKSSQFEINPGKTIYCSKPVEITGVITKLKKLETPDRILLKLKRYVKSDSAFTPLQNYKNRIMES